MYWYVPIQDYKMKPSYCLPQAMKYHNRLRHRFLDWQLNPYFEPPAQSSWKDDEVPSYQNAP